MKSMNSLENYFGEIEKILRKDVDRSYEKYQSVMDFKDYVANKIHTKVNIGNLVLGPYLGHVNKGMDTSIAVTITEEAVNIVDAYYMFHYAFYQKEMDLEDFHNYVKKFVKRLESMEWLKEPESTNPHKPADPFTNVQIDNPDDLQHMVEAFAALELLKMDEEQRASVYVDEDGKAHASIRITEDGKIEAYFLLLETPFHEKDFRKERKLRSFSEIVKLSQKWGTEI